MTTDYFRDVFRRNSGVVAIICDGNYTTYGFLSKCIDDCLSDLRNDGILPGSVYPLFGDFSCLSIAKLFALIENGNIIVPFNLGRESSVSKELSICADSLLYDQIRESGNPGLVLFTSGSTGKPKAAVHNLPKLLKKFHTPRRAYRTMNFMSFDHWGGLNTMFHTLSNGGTVVSVGQRDPASVCGAVELYRIELLPTTPTFLRLLLLSGEYRHYNLSSLKIISYGTEPMPESTLKGAKEAFRGIKLQQTYGLIELGVLRAVSHPNGSTWVKIGGDGYQTRVVDGLLEIKADSAMLGYINAPSPFTEDGWFKTGDSVEVMGDYMRILGRKTEIINVGGEKVYPAEVESVIQELPNILSVVVYGEKNDFVGNIVCANVWLIEKEELSLLTNRIRRHCRGKLQSYKIPVKVYIGDTDIYNERFKKKR